MANLALLNSLRRNLTSVPLSFLRRGEISASSVSACNNSNYCLQPTRVTSSSSDSGFKLQQLLARVKCGKRSNFLKSEAERKARRLNSSRQLRVPSHVPGMGTQNVKVEVAYRRLREKRFKNHHEIAYMEKLSELREVICVLEKRFKNHHEIAYMKKLGELREVVRIL